MIEAEIGAMGGWGHESQQLIASTCWRREETDLPLEFLEETFPVHTVTLAP